MANKRNLLTWLNDNYKILGCMGAVITSAYFVGFSQGENKTRAEANKNETTIVLLKNENNDLSEKIKELHNPSYGEFFMSNLRYLNNKNDDFKKIDFVEKVKALASKKNVKLPKGDNFCSTGMIKLSDGSEWPIPAEIKREVHKNFCKK